MILTYEQADRFYTLINALLGYANERFEVVRELPLPIVDLESQSKAALVAETLWDSVGIIDDFVRENPFDLPKRFLDTALAWKDALTGSFVFAGHEDVSRRLYLTPLMPYTFLFWQGGRFTAFAPEQTKCMLADVDFEEIERVRVRNEEVVTCAEACTTFYGVVSLDDAYLRYREACSDPVTRRRFVELIEVEASFFECGFELWECDGVDHLVHYAIGNDYAASEYARLHAPDFLDDLTSLADEVVDEGLIEKALHRMGEGLGSEWEELDGYRRFLLEEHAKNPPRPFEPSMLQRDAIGALFELSTVVQLRNFLDARVPDGEDDFFFADRVVEALVMGAMEGAGIQDLFAYVRELGLDACCEDEERLPKLITNVYNSLPSWENNGWSPQELLERMAGKKVFYNERGDVMKVGRNDPCPCGSGKKYKKCCGR